MEKILDNKVVSINRKRSPADMALIALDMLSGNAKGIIERALVYAKAAHGAADQRCKYTGEPYIVHPIAVAGALTSVRHTSVMVAAALLHDTIEDTATTLEDLQAAFGTEVAELVDWLTDSQDRDSAARKVRKERYRARIASAPAAAKTIKLADVIVNSRTIHLRDPKFARLYLAEQREMLLALEGGDSKLWSQAEKTIETSWLSLMARENGAG